MTTRSERPAPIYPDTPHVHCWHEVMTRWENVTGLYGTYPAWCCWCGAQEAKPTGHGWFYVDSTTKEERDEVEESA